MQTHLIGLAGQAGSGKNTAALALEAEGWTQRAFADPVREMLYRLDPVLADPEGEAGTTTLSWEVDRHGWNYVKRQFPEVRGYLQCLGTEAGRGVLGENVWIDTMFRGAETWGPTVITDVRFPNEAEAIREHGGVVVRIERPSVAPIREANHASETALRSWPFDAVLVNDGTVEDLQGRLAALTQPS
ncbi:hypothetical protein Q3V23_23420 [Streptomyces sp. VNUA116]|uniref:deoxynucleotide monophosphate kinase family protein n=1 Tax=Streptomyces sp. VNUA116 TaxID=3062449 RepID=UPI0026759470|nr:hypothetical protein [Streptomyces sp. VNUA116]WKU46771.1 hypothetical protein Q3V23_23420 [Streptomyces sp. VNUA116]